MLHSQKDNPSSLNSGLQDIVLEGNEINDLFVCNLRYKMTCEDEKGILRNSSIHVGKNEQTLPETIC